MKKVYTRLPVMLLTLVLGLMVTPTAFGTATIVIQNNDAAGVGFNDPTPATPVGGNNGTTVGQQRLNAFQFAASIWGATLTSGPTITINASWSISSSTCTSNQGTLGSAGNSGSIWRDFTGAVPGHWYGNALANAIRNTDLNGGTPEINAQFNPHLGTPGCLDTLHWYYGLYTNAGVGGVNLVTVLLHEFAHGLGMQTFTNRTTGLQAGDANGRFPSIYDRFLFDSTANKTWPQMTDAERVASAINTNNLVWNGPQVVSDVPSVLSAEGTPSLKVNTPPVIAGNYSVGTAEFGPTLNPSGVTANVVQAAPVDGCTALTNAAQVSGKIALIDRGGCLFVEKVKIAQNAGAVGVIIVNNVAGSPPGMAGTDATIAIPSVSITNVNGDSIKAQLGTGVNATLLLDLSTRAGADFSGRPRLYAPDPFEGGSSTSHWDESATPNQLMEPFISSDLSHSVVPPQDLTTSLLKDIGWSSGGSQPTPSPSPSVSPSPSPGSGPANNNFADAQVISGCSGSVTGTNVGANKETNEPSHSPDNDAGGGSVWYQWQAPSTRLVTITTEGSNYDSVVAVYTGNSVGALTPIVKNDDFELGVITTSSLSFHATAGTVYKIAVDGWGQNDGGARGNIVLNWSQANQVQDSSFETTTGDGSSIDNPYWDSTSTHYGSSLCSDDLCTAIATAAPRTGAYWAWFGGVAGPESGSMTQIVTIPAGGVATLNYYLRIGAVAAPFTDVLNVKVDGTTVQSFTEPSTPESGYTLRTVNLNAYANGAQHTILFEYISPSGGGTANFNLDDVSIDIPCAAAPQWQPVVLTASQIDQLKAWTTGGRTFIYVRPKFPDAGYRIVSWGTPTRTGNDFTVDASVEKFTGTSIQAVVTTAQIYDLGPLADGVYNFNFKTSGTLAKAVQFTVGGAAPPPNPIDDQRQFVRQQYLDFLGREPDGPGWDFWTDNITKCSDPARRPPTQTEAECISRQRETTSAAFFLSPEFQNTGYFVLRVFRGSLGRMPFFGGSVPPDNAKDEFTRDHAAVSAGIVVNNQLDPAVINANKQAFVNQFVGRAEFLGIYGALSNSQYVDKLFQTTGVTPTAAERTALIDGLTNLTETRASVLFKIVDGTNTVAGGALQFQTRYGQVFYDQQFTAAFVQMEYFGYMRRDPDEAGYAFWLGKLNQFGGNFVNAEMVLAFISSPEYRARFGQP